MHPETSCPPADALRDLLLGKLDGDQAERWRLHFETCPVCLKAADALEANDPVVEALREQKDLGFPPVRQGPGVAALPWCIPGQGSVTRGGQHDPATPLLPSVTPSGGHRAIPGFELLGEIGRGGMGVVERARQIKLGRLIALKTILAGPKASPTQLARFRTEAEAAAQLRHPNIVQVFEVGEHDGCPFLVLELVDGPNLDRRLEGTPLSATEAARLVGVLARAIQHAHERGVVHRDLKPSNVLIAPDGTPRIADFGLARLDGHAGLTPSEAVLGTPSYMAPEQAAGKVGAAGPLADVYSLGAILYQCLTGRPPFRGDSTLETVRQVLTEDPVPPTRLQPGLPRDLETVCLKCLHKDPARRYPSAAELAADLERFLGHEPIRARPASVVEHAGKWARRHPAAAALVVFGLFAASVLLGGVIWHTVEVARERRNVAERERQVALHEYALDMHRALRCWDDGDVAGVQSFLHRHLPSPGGDDRRGFEWYYLDRLARSSDPWTVTSHPDGASCVAFSPDGNVLASAGQDQTIRLQDLAGRTSRAVVRGLDGPVGQMTFSPDGSRFFTRVGQSVQSWQTARDHAEPRTVLSLQKGDRVAFSPGGRYLAISRLDKTVELWATSTGQKLKSLPVPRADEPIDSLAVTDDGQRIVVVRHISLFILDVASGRCPPRPLLPAPTFGLVVSSEGRTAAVLETTGGIQLVDLSNGHDLIRLPAGRTGKTRCLAFAPGGGQMVSGADDNTVRLWDSRSGALLRVFKGHSGPINSVAFRPGGREVASAGEDGLIKVWPVDERQEFRALAGQVRPGPMAFSGDGGLLVVASDDGPLALINSTSGEVRLLGAERRSAVHALALSSDGRFLATAGAEPAIQLRDVATGQTLMAFPQPGKVRLLAFSPDGRWLVAAAVGAVTRFCNLTKRAEDHPLLAAPSDVRVMAFSPDGRTLATAEGGTTVTLRDLSSGKVCDTFQERAEVTRIAWSRNGEALATGCRTGLVTVRRGGVGRWAAPVEYPTSREFLGFFQDDWKLVVAGSLAALYDTTLRRDTFTFWSPLSGSACATAGPSLALPLRDGTILLWQPEANRTVLPRLQRLAPVAAVGFSPDGSSVVIGSREPLYRATRREPEPLFLNLVVSTDHRHETGPCPELRFWDPETGAEQPTFSGQESLGVPHLAWTPDGHTLVSAGEGGLIQVWDRTTRHLRYRFFVNDRARFSWQTWEGVGPSPWGRLLRFPEKVRALAVSRDGRTVATASGRGEVKLQELSTGRLLLSLPESQEDVHCLAFSPEGRALAVNHGREIRLWQLPRAEGQGVRRMRTLRGHTRTVRCLAFASRGHLLASGGQDRQLIFWDLEQSDHKETLVAHTGTIRSLAFAPDGRTLASGAEDGKVKLWHVLTRSEMLTLSGHTGPVHAVAFSPNGRILASGGVSATGMGEAYLWQASPGPPLRMSPTPEARD
jgi:WD40 repeat protein